MNPYVDKIMAKAQELHGDWEALKTPPFRLREIVDLLDTLVEAAEAVITSPGSGKAKREAVKAAWDELDRKYGIIKSISGLLPKLVPFKQTIIRWLIGFTIKGTVTILNATVWKTDDIQNGQAKG